MAANHKQLEAITEKARIARVDHNRDESHWALVWRKFRQHKVAVVSLWVLLALYVFGAAVPGFIAPYGKLQRFDQTYQPPQRLRLFDAEGRFHFQPFVYAWAQEFDPETWQTTNVVDTSERYPIRLFVRGTEYQLFGFLRTNVHLFGVSNGAVHLFGTDQLGRDVFSRVFYACRVSLLVGLAGVAISMILGLVIGGVSGLAGGVVDDVVQRIIEVLLSIPQIPLWLAFAAAVPDEWGPIQVYFAITVIISLISWPGLARVVRSKFLALREEDFVMAARGYNAPTGRIVFRHLIPNFISYVLVSITLAIPHMIIAETSLSFLGVGLRPPVVSLGVLLKQAQNFQDITLYPWLLLPGAFVVLFVLAFNFVGDGLRDAADPYA